MQNRTFSIFLLFVLAIGVGISVSSCSKEKFFEVEDSEWRMLIIWDAGPHVNWDLNFKAGGDLTMVDDTASYTGSWSRVEQVVSWTVEIPDREITAKSTLDKKKMEGTLTDATGYAAIFTGDRQ